MLMEQKGICCVCQSPHNIKKRLLSPEELEEQIDGEEMGIVDEANYFAMKPHDFCGQPCQGVGQVPQALID